MSIAKSNGVCVAKIMAIMTAKTKEISVISNPVNEIKKIINNQESGIEMAIKRNINGIMTAKA
jgi:hypothetical protein